MAITKTSRTLYASASITPGNSAVATELDLSTKLGALINVKISLPGSVVTVAPTITFFTGEATGIKRKYFSLPGSVTLGDYPMEFSCRIPPAAMFANVTVTNTAGATNNLTVEMYAQELTSV